MSSTLVTRARSFFESWAPDNSRGDCRWITGGIAILYLIAMSLSSGLIAHYLWSGLERAFAENVLAGYMCGVCAAAATFGMLLLVEFWRRPGQAREMFGCFLLTLLCAALSPVPVFVLAVVMVVCVFVGTIVFWLGAYTVQFVVMFPLPFILAAGAAVAWRLVQLCGSREASNAE